MFTRGIKMIDNNSRRIARMNALTNAVKYTEAMDIEIEEIIKIAKKMEEYITEE